MPAHICKPYVSCRCWVGADAPDDDCPIHGGGVAHRCACGRFTKRHDSYERWLRRTSAEARAEIGGYK